MELRLIYISMAGFFLMAMGNLINIPFYADLVFSIGAFVNILLIRPIFNKCNCAYKAHRTYTYIVIFLSAVYVLWRNLKPQFSLLSSIVALGAVYSVFRFILLDNKYTVNTQKLIKEIQNNEIKVCGNESLNFLRELNLVMPIVFKQVNDNTFTFHKDLMVESEKEIDMMAAKEIYLKYHTSIKLVYK